MDAQLPGAIAEVKQAVCFAVWKALQGEYRRILEWTDRCTKLLRAVCDARDDVRCFEEATLMEHTRECVRSATLAKKRASLTESEAKLRVAVKGAWKMARVAFADPAELPEVDSHWMGFSEGSKGLLAPWERWSTMARNGMNAVDHARAEHMAAWGVQTQTLEEYEAYLLVKGLFSDRLSTDTDPALIAPDARYQVTVKWERAQRDDGSAPARLSLVMQYMQDLMHEGLLKILACQGREAANEDIDFYVDPAFIGRTPDSGTQLSHRDMVPGAMERRLGEEPAPGQAGIHTFSALLCLDDQAYTELMPESVAVDFQHGLPAPYQGYPTSHPFQRVRVGGGPGWLMMWPSTHVAHRGVCPGKTFPNVTDPAPAAYPESLPFQRSLSIVLFGALTVLPGGKINLENTVDTLPHQVGEMYGLPVRMVCFACREAIAFEGSYEHLPRVYACTQCVHVIPGTDIKEIGEVMCGSCFDHRHSAQPAMGPPLRTHELHPDVPADLSSFERMDPEEAKARAVLNFADVAMVCRMLTSAFGKDAKRDAAERLRLANMQFARGAPEKQEQRPVDISHTPVQASTVPNFHAQPIFKEMGATCPTAQSVAFAMWVAARRPPPVQPQTVPLEDDEPGRQLLEALDGIIQRETADQVLQNPVGGAHTPSPADVGCKRKQGKRKRGKRSERGALKQHERELERQQKKRRTAPRRKLFDEDGYLDPTLEAIIARPDTAFALRVAAVITHGWDATKPAFACRCNCVFAHGLRKETEPGWDGSVLSMRPVGPCQCANVTDDSRADIGGAGGAVDSPEVESAAASAAGAPPARAPAAAAPAAAATPADPADPAGPAAVTGLYHEHESLGCVMGLPYVSGERDAPQRSLASPLPEAPIISLPSGCLPGAAAAPAAAGATHTAAVARAPGAARVTPPGEDTNSQVSAPSPSFIPPAPAGHAPAAAAPATAAPPAAPAPAPAAAAAAPATSAPARQPCSRVAGLTQPTLGTYTVYGRDGVEHHVQGNLTFEGREFPVVKDLATTHPLLEFQVLWKLPQQQRADGKYYVDSQMPEARRLLTEVQPASVQRFECLEEIQGFLATASLQLRDVIGDGDCWLRAICPYVDGMTKHTRHGLDYFVNKLRTAMVVFQEENCALFPWLNFRSPEAIALKKRKSASDAESLLVLAAMTQRVIQCYRIIPPQDLRDVFLPMACGEEAPALPFSMVHYCPPDGMALKSSVPIRVLHLLPGDGYPGHYMRIAPSHELQAEDERCSGLLQRGGGGGGNTGGNTKTRRKR